MYLLSAYFVVVVVFFNFINTIQSLSLSSASVFSVSIDPVNNSMAVSGGEDDKAYVWRLQDGETLMECRGIIAILYIRIVTILVSNYSLSVC